MTDSQIRAAVRAKRRFLERCTETNVRPDGTHVEEPFFDQYELDAELADYEAELRAA